MQPNYLARFLYKALACLMCGFPVLARAAEGTLKGSSVISNIVILEVRGTVELRRAGASVWDPASASQILFAGDHLRTRERSHATLLLLGSPEQIGALSEFEVEALPTREAPATYKLWRGVIYFFHREHPVDVRFNTRIAAAAIRGTEFNLAAEEDGRTVLTLLDGEVVLSNAVGELNLRSGEQGVAQAGTRPTKTAVVEAVNVIQWCLYYPGLLDVDELRLEENDRRLLAGSLNGYRNGDLLQALAQYPLGRQPASDEEKVYLGAVLLAVGQVAQTESLLESLPRGGNDRTRRLATATEHLIATVKLQAWRRTQTPEFATEWLSESYYLQSRSDLAGALAAARKAVETSPNFGFGWERVAELEFSFGRTSEALRALEKSLALAPRNAQAFALKGFLLSAENRIPEARQCFEQAISLDGALANAWLGRGLCRLRRGDSAGGVEDLTVAAALEPQRALLRSYLGKAYTAVDDYHRASKELKLAINLDHKDPTAWLYSALLKQQQNRVNEAIGDLETSEDLNDNRSLFRSRLLLDEDLAVSSANLASIYRDAGMTDVSVREAARAVTYDYANASAHLFLSDSYNELRDPTRFDLRYETAWFNELLLANLLAPIGGGRLSQHVSQQEYSSLFQADGLGFANSTLGRSDNKSVTELASQYGTFGGTSYALDLDYQHNGGVRPNNGLDSIEWYSTVKQQITPQDTLFALVKYEDYNSGDNFQYYYQTNARPNYQYTEYQQPIVVGGWHHEWSPGVHTLLLGGRLSTEQDFSDIAAPQILLSRNTGAVFAAGDAPFDVNLHDTFEIYLAELNQIFQWDRVTLSLGGRWQGGSFQTQSQFTSPPAGLAPLFSDPVAQASLTEGFNRYTSYGYLTVEPLEHLWLTGGAAYDDITYPDNFRNPPLSPGEAHTYQLGPKAGLVWSPVSLLTVRGAYTRSLGGVSEDESYRLEQTQVAGFPQTFRSLIPESIVGSVSAPAYQTYSAALDLKFPSRTYAGIQVQRLETDVNRTDGTLSLDNYVPPFVSSSTPEQLRYREPSVGGSINQLLGDAVVVGAGSSYNQARLQDSYPKIPLQGYNSTVQADLQETSGYVLLNHPSGLFARVDATWYHQVNSGYAAPGLPGDSFVQENLYVGYRFLHRHAEIMFGILNLSDQDYHLNPLSTYAELPRERSFILRLNFIF